MVQPSAHLTRTSARTLAAAAATLLLAAATAGCNDDSSSSGKSGTSSSGKGANAVSSHCKKVDVPVTLHGKPAHGHITGDYCVPQHPQHPATTLLMDPGGSENADYWNTPGLRSYSLTEAAAKKGYASMALDRLGTGRSTKPDSSKDVTYDNQVSTAHQVATYLHRKGQRVAGVGHSLGSGALAGVEAKHPKDMSALVLTGYGPAVSPEVPKLNKKYQAPARTVSKRWKKLDPGYKTVRPKTFAHSGRFYLPGTTKAALKASTPRIDLLTMTELKTRPQGPEAKAQNARIRGPVLVTDGQEDRNYCLANKMDEPTRIDPHCGSQPAFRRFERKMVPNADLTTRVVPRTGHGIQYERTAPSSNRNVLNWLSKNLKG